MRDELLRVASDTLCTEGSVTIRGVARVAGVSAPTVLHHFQSKAALVHELAVVHAQFYEQLLDEIARDATDARARLATLVEHFANQHAAGQHCAGGTLAAGRGLLEPMTREVVRGFFAALTTWVTTTLVDAGLSTKLARRRALAFVAALEGALVIDLVGESADHLEAVQALIGDFL